MKGGGGLGEVDIKGGGGLKKLTNFSLVAGNSDHNT